MTERSRAFRDASLRSEEQRAVVMIVVLVVVLSPVLAVVTSQPTDASLRIVGAGAGALVLLIQVCCIAVARRARRTGEPLPGWFAVVSVCVESSVPTMAMYAHIRIGHIQPYTVLTLPPLLAYGVFASLTTLRLRPWLSVLGSVVSTAGYLGLLAYVRFGLGLRPPESGWPAPGYFMAALLVLVVGLASAWIARELRSHVHAALDEAEVKRKMERVEQDLQVARTIQQSLLPREAPVIEGFDIAAWNRPADQTGGDYYDWQRLPDGNWIASLADVSGHGIGPALVTAACRAYVRASSAHHLDLASLAARVNQLLADDLPGGRFVTMVSVLISPAGGPLALLSAGHGPIVLYLSATGEVREILANGLPLAVLREHEFEPAHAVDLLPGDVLALVTDGFVEWARFGADGAREEFGLERLVSSLKRHAHMPASELISAVTRDTEAFARGEPQQDDLTILVIKRAAGAHPHPTPPT